MLKKLFYTAMLLLAGAAAPAVNNGFVSVGRSNSPVKIDGKLDERSWQNTVVLSPFILHKQNRAAVEQTAAQLLWDDENLYIAYRCYERALDPVENRLHAFKAAIKTNDDPKLFNDDCVLLILLRDEKSFDIAINANGCVLDAAGKASDIWRSRNVKWNSSLRAAVSRFDRNKNAHWVVEAAIPWSSLGGMPRHGEKWRIALGRFEKSAGESSSFQLVEAGFHHRSSTAGLKFVKEVIPGIVPQTFPAMIPGSNFWDFKQTAPGMIALSAQVKFAGKSPERFRSGSSGNKLTLPLQLRDNGEFTFQWSVENPASFSEYIRSPEYTFRVNASILRHNYKNAVLMVNGIKAGPTAMLSSGLNRLELKGKADGGVITAGGQQIILQDNSKLNLLLNDSLVWPNWTVQGVAIPADNYQQILFVPRGVKNMRIDDYTINFDLPEGFEFAGASGYYKKWPLTWQKGAQVKYGKKNYRRYTVRINTTVPFNDRLRKHEFIAVLLKAPAQLPQESSTVYYHISSAKNNLQELPNPIKVKVLPKLQGRQPTDLLVQLWCGWLGSLDDAGLYKYYGKLFKDAGFNEVNGLNNNYPGLRHFRLISFQNWNFPLDEYLKQHPDQKLVSAFTSFKDNYVCSTAMIKDPAFAEFFRSRLKAWHRQWDHPHNIHWDYEWRVFESFLACFCPRCLKDFQQFVQLPATPAPVEIKEHYSKEWTRYMNIRMAEVSELFQKAIKDVLPGVDYSIYSAYQSESSKFFYGLDWNLLDGKVSIACCGYSRNLPELQATHAALKNTPLMTGELVYPYRETERMAPLYASAATLMRRACDGTKGVLIYEYPTLDGRTFAAMASVSRIMSDHGEFFTVGDRCAEELNIHGFDRADYEVLRNRRGDLLVILMNPANGSRKFSFSLKKSGVKRITDAVSGKDIAALPVSGSIKSTGFRAFVIKYR